MTARTRIYQCLIVVLGLAYALRQSFQAEPGNERLFFAYLGLTVLSSFLRLGVPTSAGTMSIGFVFILASLARLDLSQTLAIGVCGTVLQCLRAQQKDKVDWFSLAFQTATVVLGIQAAAATFERVSVLVPGGGLTAGLPLAATVLFLVTAFPLAAATALRQGQLLRRVWQDRFLWSLPFYLAGAALAGLITAAERTPWWQTSAVMLPLLLLLHRAYGLQLDSLGRQRRRSEDLASLQMSMVEALALAVESKDTSGTDHLQRMTVFTVGLASRMGLERSSVEALRAAAVLHDIGQVAVPDQIIMKQGSLTAEEYERLKVHPAVGADIIERANFPYPVAPIVAAHHERWDGQGYPLGLRGDAIPLEARVLSAVDQLVSLTSPRHHRSAIGLDKAMEAVRQQAGLSLDPAVVEALGGAFRELDQEARTAAGQSSAATTPESASSRSPGEPDRAQAREAPSFLATISAARREEQSLLEFTRILGSSLDLRETLNELARRFRLEIPFDSMVLYWLRDQRLEPVFIEGEYYSIFNGSNMARGEGLSGAVAATGRPVVNADPAAEPAFHRNPAKMARLRSALSVPLEGANGVAGVLTFYAEQRDAFTASQLSLLVAIGPKLAMTVDNSLRFQKAEDQAAFDYLTGLPNAGSLFAHLQSELARAVRNSAGMAVLVCDLDGFKQVNDRFGHLTGNKLLQAVSRALKDNCREYDFVARMGGDEFVITLPGAESDAVRLRRLQLTSLVEAAGAALCGETVVSLSMGVAYFPQDGRTTEELLATADMRMYEDKALRKSTRSSIGANTAHSWMPSTRD